MPNIKYSTQGEWVSDLGDRWRIGMTQSVADDLGEVTFVELPSVSTLTVAGEVVCVIEAVKAATDFYAPVSGRIVSVNQDLGKAPHLVNSSPEDRGWIYEVTDVSSKEWLQLRDPSDDRETQRRP